MVTRQVENLLVTGRCVSATRIAAGVIRTTAHCMVMGEAAGTAAALSIQQGQSFQNLDVQRLQNTLKKNGAVL